ncbi:MAG: hypothetical protein M3Y82_15100 [Verrucomicrobiota bacterium]|nr:hypothetical protein [Verrucomicrobiota bacterium]
MNDELKIQACLDGELSAREARQITERLSSENEARELFAELQFTKTALAGNELELKLPETRDFYWSKIQRQIEQEGRLQNSRESKPFFYGRRKFFLPLAGAAALVSALVSVSHFTHPLRAATYVPGAVETFADMAASTFRSQSEKMTIVWLENREINLPTTEQTSENNIEML